MGGRVGTQRTFSICPAAKPTTTRRHFHAAHLRLGMSMPWCSHRGEKRKRSSVRSNLGTRLVFQTHDWIENDVDSLPTGDPHDLLLPPFLRIVDAEVCSSDAFANFKLLLRSSGRDDLAAERVSDLDGGETCKMVRDVSLSQGTELTMQEMRDKKERESETSTHRLPLRRRERAPSLHPLLHPDRRCPRSSSAR